MIITESVPTLRVFISISWRHVRATLSTIRRNFSSFYIGYLTGYRDLATCN